VIQDASTQLLRRLERGAVIWCVLAAGAVLALAPSRTDVLLGIAGGGVLAIVSFYAIRGSVDAAVRALAPGPGGSDPARARLGPLVVKMTGRYALLALLAYVMIARLRLPPLGLLAGASSIVAAVAVEAVRFLFKKDFASRT